MSSYKPWFSSGSALVCSALLTLLALVAAGCSPTIPEGRFACVLDTDCPPDFSCQQSLCYSDNAGPDMGTVCSANAECADDLFCNGIELCLPQLADADAQGCVTGEPACSAGFLCAEETDSCAIDCATPDPDGDGHDSVFCGGDDCDDMDADRFPGNPETCLDSEGGKHDEDCDPLTFGFLDADGDGEVSNACCNVDTGSPACGSDCDDADSSRRSGQVEFCDLVDNDCDGTTDNATTAVDWYLDADDDGFGAPGVPMSSCVPLDGYSLFNTDCDDTDATRHPAQLELCDLVENNCNGLTDEQPYCGTIVLVSSGGATLMRTVSDGGMVSLVVPPAGLTSSTPISVGEYHPRSLPPLAAGQRFIGLPIAVTPFTVTFDLLVTLTLPAQGTGLVVLALDGPDDRSWEELSASFEGGFATIPLSRGGIFAVATQVCPLGTWDHDGIALSACVPWTMCAAGTFVESGGSAASDRVCVPCLETEYSTTSNALKCVPHTTCSPGEFAVVSATETRDRECQACANGTFAELPNSSECTSWSTCASSTLEVAPGSATSDVVCEPLGWTRQFGTAGVDSGGHVAVTSTGDVYVVGQTATQLPGTPAPGGLLVRKYTRTGTELWSRHLPAAVGDYLSDVHIGPSNSLYLLTDTGGGIGSRVSRINQSGVVEWTTPGIPQYVNAFTVDPLGNAYVGGAFNGWALDSTGQDAKLIKYGPTGSVVWGPIRITTAAIYHAAPDAQPTEEAIQAIVTDASGGLYIAGYSGSSFPAATGVGRSFVQRLSPTDGSTTWTRHFGSNTVYMVDVASMALSPDGGTLYATGRASEALPGQATLGADDAFVQAFTSGGAASWTRQISTAAYEVGQGLVVLGGGDVVVTGPTTGVLDPLATFGGGDVFVERLQGATGTLVRRVVFGTSSGDGVARSMAAYTDGYIVLGGSTGGTLPFDDQQSAGSSDIYVRRMLLP